MNIKQILSPLDWRQMNAIHQRAYVSVLNSTNYSTARSLV